MIFSITVPGVYRMNGTTVDHKLFVPYVMRSKLGVRITNIMTDRLHRITAV